MQEEKRNGLAKGRVGCNVTRMGCDRGPRIFRGGMYKIENVEQLLNAGATGEVLGSEGNDEMTGFRESGCLERRGIMGVPNVAEKTVNHAILEGCNKLP